MAHVLQHVSRQDHVEGPLRLRRDPEVQIGLDEAVDPLLHTLVGDEVDTGDVVARFAQALGQHAVRAPEVEDAPRRPVAQPAEDDVVRAARALLELVGLAVERELAAAEAHLVGAVAEDVTGDVPCVAETVDVADLVAVVGGDRDLDDALPGLDQLHDDLRVEVEVVVVAVEGQVPQGGHRVGPVARVPLRERRAGGHVLDPGEDLVADVLVERHAATAGGPLVEHAGAEHRVGLAAFERGHHRRQGLGGVLTVGVEHHHDVEVLVDRPVVAGLLVAAVAQVAGVADDLEGQVGGQLLVAEGHQVGAVLAGVVADEHLRDAAAEGLGDAVEDRRQRGCCVVRDDEDADALRRHGGSRAAGHGRHEGTCHPHTIEK